MRQLIVLAGFCIISAGCNGEPDSKEAVHVYEAVLKEELKGSKKGEGFYVFIDGVDPEPELLKQFQKQWPELQPGSKKDRGQGIGVSVDGLKWIDRNTADLRGGFSNGKDGRGSRYRVVRKNGAWLVESAKVEVLS